MASTRQIASWKVYAVAEGKSILRIFPVLNDPSVLPVTELDEFARRSVARRDREPGLRRADFLFCLRALKIIEQIVYSHSKTSVGPLQMTLSIVGIVEQSPSWTSVLHALGVVTSYDSTETYRKRLIAEREQAADRAFSEVQLENRVVTLQIDNFDMLPLHSVKASGKRIPMISGTATQGVVHSRKRRRLTENTPVQNCHSMAAHSAGADMSWRDPKDVLPSRDRFIKCLHSPTDQNMLDDFFDIVFGVVHEHRDIVLGIGDSAGTYKRGPKVKSYKHKGINFRTLMLSCFKQHGGLDSSHPALAEQEVLFVDISRMSAADILTIHQKLALIKQLVRPGEPGRPVYVVLSGDQPTYKMIVKIWRNSYCESKRGNSREPLCGELQVHEWLIPFPGFFHVEKQSLYPLCKEILHGVGLQELAACSGLSESQIDNILRHSHARNNHAVLSNICAALVVHTSDLIKTECPEVRDSIKRIEDGADSDQGAATGRSSIHGGDSKLLSCLSSRVTDRTIEIGRLLRKRVLDFFVHSPNGKHIVCTALFTCFLPTLGFHILSRTGHTDVLDGFWLRLNNVLHASGHLKYQELYLFYAFLRCIIPPTVVQDIFLNKPGAMVARVPAFTSGLGSPYDTRGWNYVHLDEILEMLIVRLVKGLNVLMLQYLETSAAWLLAVSRARMMIRSVTAASHSYQRSRQADEGSQDFTPMTMYDMSAVQSKTVYAMLQLMRTKGFLSLEHRSCEKLCNVLGDSSEDLDNLEVQQLILDVDNHGRKSAELHAAAMLPDVFGPLSDADISKHFDGTRFRGEWTKKRQIPTIGSVMAARRASPAKSVVKLAKDPKKSLADRRLILNKLMTTLTLAEQAAISDKDMEGAEHARGRWQLLHKARYLMSPFADAYRSAESGVRHAKKSQILSALKLNSLQEVDGTQQSIALNEVGCRESVSFYYDYNMPQYATVMVDLMNHIWSGGTDGRRGNSLFQVTVLKLKHMLRPWFTGRRSRHMRQLHLHIDDPSIVIPRSEVNRCDAITQEMRKPEQGFQVTMNCTISAS